MNRQNTFLLLVLIFLFAADLPGQQNGKPILIKRYERGYSLHSLEDNAAYLADSAGPAGKVAVRFCSQERMPVALSLAAVDPFVISPILEVYGFTPERVLYLRSGDCLGPNPAVSSTELWAIPKGTALPASVESVSANQVRLKTFGTNNKVFAGGASDYRAATQQLIKRLRGRPGTVGIVLGYYYRRPNPVMQRRLREVRRLLEQSGLPRDRYFVRLAPWNGEYGIDPPDPEPRYPSVSIVEVTRDSARR